MTYWLILYWDLQDNLSDQPEAVQAAYYMGHSLPGLMIMADMWFINSVTFIYS